MKQFTTDLSTGNCYGLQRSRHEMVESVRIVSGAAHDSFVYDSFAFVMDDVTEWDVELPDSYIDQVLVGTSTMSCFELEGDLIGGLLVSVPWSDSFSDSITSAFFDSYKEKFGIELVTTISNRPTEDTEYIGNLGVSQVGLDAFDVDFISETASTVSFDNATVQVFGFVSKSTLNFVYLLSEGQAHTKHDFESIVRQLDTLTVFEAPLAQYRVEGTVFAPCERVLSSPKFQSYLESEFKLSDGPRINLGNMSSPSIYLDSVLKFSFSPQLSSDVTVEVIGSRNANHIESQLRQSCINPSPIDTSELVAFKDGVVGEQVGRDGEVFIGECYVDWACDCSGGDVCPTVVVVYSDGEVSDRVIREVDEVLGDVEGREAFELTVEGLESL